MGEPDVIKLETRFLGLTPRHAAALRWFADRSGMVVGWPEPLLTEIEPTFLATKAKGIYKPIWSEYALSVRQSLGGPYPDRDPLHRSDGTWGYQYFQERVNIDARDAEFTNRGLLACWRDEVPVGVMRQVKKKPDAQYRIEGVALVAGWDAGYFFFEGFAPSAFARRGGAVTEIELLVAGASVNSSELAELTGIDARERVVTSIVRRRGQGRFRVEVLRAYSGRCAVSGCDAEAVLEAAHISPYRGPDTNDVRNGLLLRSDLHTLFDLGLIAVDVAEWKVVVSQTLRGTTYQSLHGHALAIPDDKDSWPSELLLRKHRTWAGF